MAEQWVTSDMKTAFLRSARGEDVACAATVLKPGTTGRCTGRRSAAAPPPGWSRTTSLTCARIEPLIHHARVGLGTGSLEARHAGPLATAVVRH